MAASSGRRCHYEVLGVRQEATADEIKSAYRKLALQLHPDKLVQSGLSQSEATAKFQELAQAYEVLSDPKERAWYDSHRSQILFADPNSGDSVPDSVIPNLFSFFSNTVYSGYTDSKKGFYRVYSDVFNKIYANEVNFARKLGLGLDSVKEAPAMGDLESPYNQVTAFYGYWLGFSTVMDFCWVDQYDAMAGVNRKSRRVMEEENRKVRKKARREYNETVRGLAEFVKKRDKRVIDMAVKRNLETEKRKEEERERKKKMERERLERAMAYEEPEWSRTAEEEDLEEEENGVEEVEVEKKELYCVVCRKKFKSEKQWKNHEQSKKHRDKVAEFRESIGDDEEFVEDGLDGEEGEEKDDVVEELVGKMRDGLRVGEEEEVELSNADDDELGEVGTANGIDEDGKKAGFDAEDDDGDSDEKADNGVENNVDDEIGVLEAMLGRRKNRKKTSSLRETNGTSINVCVENDDDDDDFLDYNKRKSTRRSRRARQERSGKTGEENLQPEEPSSSQSLAENQSTGTADDPLADNTKSSNQNVARKANSKNDANTKSKNSSKGKKANKATPSNSSNACEKCGEEFESKNKLHKHLADTGHASLKYR